MLIYLIIRCEKIFKIKGCLWKKFNLLLILLISSAIKASEEEFCVVDFNGQEITLQVIKEQDLNDLDECRKLATIHKKLNLCNIKKADLELVDYDIKNIFQEDSNGYNEQENLQFIKNFIKSSNQIHVDSNDKFVSTDSNFILKNDTHFQDELKVYFALKMSIKKLFELNENVFKSFNSNKLNREIYVYCNQLSNLIYKFRFNKCKVFKSYINAMKDIYNKIGKQIVKLALNKDKESLLFLSENLVQMNKKDSQTVLNYLENID